MHNFTMKLKTIEESLYGCLNKTKLELEFQDKITKNNIYLKKEEKEESRRETLDYDKEPPIVIIILNIYECLNMKLT